MVALGLGMAAMSTSCSALEVYQWTDQDGVIHFSQWSPGRDVANVETVQVDGGDTTDNGLGVSEQDDPEGYEAHRAEMDALRAEMEARREAGRRRQEASPTPQVVYVPYADPGWGSYFWPGGGLRPPHKPGKPPSRPKPPPSTLLPLPHGSPVQHAIPPAALKRP